MALAGHAVCELLPLPLRDVMEDALAGAAPEMRDTVADHFDREIQALADAKCREAEAVALAARNFAAELETRALAIGRIAAAAGRACSLSLAERVGRVPPRWACFAVRPPASVE